ncbi:isochorismate synthase [Acaryochloris sp. 'Moss Beach']|uniref:isochorismate synthase n=1 Tax=Acaryochloris sp. 'Moss Beach' TaxID=2740837 RepID=UPI001F016623|nr:isochorismate synthase [Acaryochloris sp. 'Moss Beach']UJB70307.1 isochorismate synthase [Acaryochloris sp. 'Moss Beach']
MTVTSSSANLFQDRKSLHEFLASCRTIALEKEHAQVVSLSLELPKLDPLAALDLLQQADHPHFYWEKQSQRTAIAATEPLLHLQIDGTQRFTQAQHFICTSLVDTVSAGALHLPFAGPHFFCSFTFFDRTNQEQAFFPAASVFLPRWQVACVQDQAVLVANAVIDSETALEPLARSIWEHWQLLQTPRRCPSPRSQPSQFTYPQLTNADAFTTAVADTLGLIKANKLQKLVLAHTLDVKTPQPLDLCHALGTLRERYPECYVFAVSNGQGQSFIGASPERLIELHDHHLVTDALAGSAPRGLSHEDDQILGNQLLSSKKDGHEHRVVLDFIRDSLWELGITPQVTSLPHLLQLPNIQHLRTLITAEVPQHLHLLEILAALHPTPAVAGMPREVAQQQIHHQETFERHLYAAPLGWIDYQGNGEFTVGIRSALINGSQARLYAGAGIVAGSDPQRELAEIQLKLHTLLDALL